MPSSGYTAITFVANEQPTTAKWNLIGSNDASFNTGDGFNDAIIKTRHLAAAANLQIPNDRLDGTTFVRFSAYRNAALSTGGAGSFTVPFDTEDYDVGNGHSGGTFTAPVAGYYEFFAHISVSGGYSSYMWPNFNKNGVGVRRGIRSSANHSNGSGIFIYHSMYLAAGDTVNVTVANGAAMAVENGTSGGAMTYWHGKLLTSN